MEDGVFNLEEYAGPDGYAASTVMPAHQGLLRFLKASKAKCKSACDKDPKCVGFKHGNGGCSLMQKKAKKAKKVKARTKKARAPLPKVTPVKAPHKSRPSNEKLAKAKITLNLAAKKMSADRLRAIALRARVHAKRSFKPLPANRNTRRAAKRNLRNAMKARKRQLWTKAWRGKRKQLVHKLNKRIRSKLRNLPANTKAGSQRKIAIKMMHRERARFTRNMKRRIAKQLKKDKVKYKRMLKKAPKGIVRSGILARVTNKLKSGYKRAKRKTSFKITRADIHRLSPNLSKKADNLKGCPKIKHMCKVSRRVRKQCPHTCFFLKKERALARQKVLQAKKVIVKRRLAREKVVRKKLKRSKLSVNESYEKNARLKEKSLKMRLKVAKLKKQLPKQTKIHVKTPAEIQKGKERAHKVQMVVKTAKKWEKKGIKTIRKGKKTLKKAGGEVKHEKKKTSRAKLRTTAVVLRKKGKKKGSTKLIKPKQKGSIKKAVKDAKKVKHDLKKGYKQIKRGKPALQKAQRMLKVAIRAGQGKPITKSQYKMVKKATMKKPTKKQLKKLAAKRARDKAHKVIKYHHGVVTAEAVKKPKTKAAKRKAKKAQHAKKVRKKVKKKAAAKKKPSVKSIKKKDAAGAKRKIKAAKAKAAKKVKGGKAAAFTHVPKNAEKLAAKGKHLNSKRAAKKAAKAVKKKAAKLKKKAAKSRVKKKKAAAKAKKKSKLKKKAAAKAKAKGGIVKKASTKGGKELGASMGYRQHLVIRDRSGCNYQPPAGCGCSGTVLPQQTEPNELGDTADPVSTNNCPKMPADCACRVSPSKAELTATTLAATELVLAQESSSTFGGGIVCRIRAAVKLVQVKYPVLLSHFKASAAFQKNHKAIAPLLSCVQDSTKPNKACEAFLPQAMSVAGDLLPKLAKMKNKVAAQYRKEITKQCE
jgi:hypothetical protein